jgi:general secretion pathway protein K
MRRLASRWRRLLARAGDDRAAALVTVLTMVSIMSALAVVVVDAASMSTRRTFNQTRMEQTQWYLMGAEAFAIGKLSELARMREDAAIDQNAWLGRSFTFPLDDGAMEVSLRDGANCFNLNNVAQDIDGIGPAANPNGIMQLARLLDLIGIRSDRAGLGAALADWIDADMRPVPGGIEDGAYATGAPYRPANTLLADMSELRQVQGFNADIMARIEDYVCVRPTTAPNLLNPNTLTPDQAILLSTVMPDLSVEEARQVIRDRPNGGWQDLDAFFMHPRIAGLEMNELRRASFSMESAYVVMSARVTREGGRESVVSLISIQPGGSGHVVRRLFGVEQGL